MAWVLFAPDEARPRRLSPMRPAASQRAQPIRPGGAAVRIFDSLDARALHLRQRRRPWWRFW